ncbi:MAG: hypothetical protein ACI379_14305 [Nocardioides sp.]|uniref:hypothetical protein n=1 Tax=Nocardioides sp. TaxID=35761 RepID=UPI003F0DCADB
MDVPALLSAWIAEALSVRGNATPLTVSREVWSRHEQDLRTAGDLLYTWQLDLLATAEGMAADGHLSVAADGTWTLTAPAGAPLPRRVWTAEEIAVAVDGYLRLLAAEHAGEPAHVDEVVAEIGRATGWSGDALDRMLANISAVVQEHGLLPLSSIRPRSNVPVGVRPAVADALADIS